MSRYNGHQRPRRTLCNVRNNKILLCLKAPEETLGRIGLAPVEARQR